MREYSMQKGLYVETFLYISVCDYENGKIIIVQDLCLSKAHEVTVVSLE